MAKGKLVLGASEKGVHIVDRDAKTTITLTPDLAERVANALGGLAELARRLTKKKDEIDGEKKG